MISTPLVKKAKTRVHKALRGSRAKSASDSDVSLQGMHRVDVRDDGSQEGRAEMGLKVLFLSSDTGGGHRASAESLAKQFQLQYPGTTYDLLDVMSEDGCKPYNTLVQAYKHLSAHPKQWKIVYGVSNTRAYEMLADVHLRVMCERAIRKRIKSYNPDVVVSVHPLMTNVPVVSCKKISEETGRHLPMFTVVTDLGSGHCLWFANGVDKMFIASEEIRTLAKSRGKVSDDKLVQTGLPIRHDFAVQAKALGDRMSEEGRMYQKDVREDLGLCCDSTTKIVLVMGGGEGVGSLSSIVDSLYTELTEQGIDGIVVVVCGRNKKLQLELQERNWNNVLLAYRGFQSSKGCWNGSLSPTMNSGCLEGGVTKQLRRILSSSSILSNGGALSHPMGENTSIIDTEEEETKEMGGDVTGLMSDNCITRVNQATPNVERLNVAESRGQVEVVPLGFVTQMAEYMVAADVLVSKAGPGTIAEAASVGLPVLLTSYLPGQEEGNVDYVVDGGFGAFCPDSYPAGIAEQVAHWLMDGAELKRLSRAARLKGAPNAAADIVKVIGDSTLEWRRRNQGMSANLSS